MVFKIKLHDVCVRQLPSMNRDVYKRQGKSRIGLVLKRLMGDAASNGSVQKVENNRFARADLERRLLMIDAVSYTHLDVYKRQI